MFKLACPGCGAEVVFRSATSAMAVCEYCRSTLLREGDGVRDAGKMAVVLEDYSPIRITTSGMYAGKAFGVVGRIQLRYEDGFWNEWYILFDDGSAGWLSDASGQYAITVDAGQAADAPSFVQTVPGGQYAWDGITYTASDLRSARCTAGEGELPFQVGPGWEARVVDYRQTVRFLTLDYSEEGKPRRYAGKAVSLEDLRCQLLREPDEILRSAGHLKGKAEALACPSCGASIEWRPAVATHLHCPACGAESEASTVTLELMEAGRREAALETTLKLGDEARIDGTAWTLIGLMKCRETGGSDEWVEYLLYSEGQGFLWLVESSAGWDKVKVLNIWPESVSASAVRHEGNAYTRMQAYGAQVVQVAGAFNWRVRAGDAVAITDYRGSSATLSSERSPAELTWSLAQRVPATTIDGWFGRKGKLAAGATVNALAGSDEAGSDGERRQALRPLAWVFTVLILLINVPIAVFGGLYSFFLILIAVAVLWLPVYTGLLEE